MSSLSVFLIPVTLPAVLLMKPVAYNDVYNEIIDTVDVGTTGWFHCRHCRHRHCCLTSREKSLTGRSTLTSLPGEHPKHILVPGWSAFVFSARPELGCDQLLKLRNKVSWPTVLRKPSWESNTPKGTTERDSAATTVTRASWVYLTGRIWDSET